jgi:RND family efflux transporter MFP subunit
MKTYCLLLVIPVLIISCSQPQTQQSETEDIKNAFVLKKQEVSKIMELPAELLPYERVELNAKVEGYVQRLLVDIGAKVKKGDLLTVLEAPETIAHYAEANARYREAEATFSASKDRYGRILSAAKRQGVIAEAEVVNAQNQMLADRAAMISARSTATAYGQLQSYLSVRAPFDGVITKRFIDPGDFVGASGKTTLLTIEQPDKLRLRVYVPETYVTSVPTGDSISFTTESVYDKVFSAALARKSGSIDPDTRTELWEYEYDNNNDELKPGMYAVASLELKRPTSTFMVPHPALVTSLEKKFVVRVKDGKTEWVDVREGISNENDVEIFGDLDEGDMLLSRGSEELKPGMEVSIREMEP